MAWLMRRASLDDLDAIMEIESSTFGSDAWSARAMASELDNPHTYYLVAIAEDGNAIEGYSGLLAPRGGIQADIQTIAVAASARRKGLGRAMMLQMITEARQRGAREVFLEVRADNPGAQALYEQLGFEAIAVRPRYYQPDGVDAVVMRHALEAPRASPAIGVDHDH
ncbi:ribosomal protein S18-alanine N-acetyltransferase [Homoserinimonas hongtaonis]|uniref:Ribosomal-protein-alanine N-acetyltransferase n=1 Tax=Homoserinimonas hongtaonis TaxID=2079791 RepID=A0A2U1T0N7_9MICO|nr:ribosomal protein S18-alanine N-acetyltransferase [Salinibacterium hongtaonis]AWB89963.1 ribosomal-protein-alanine N-acetyltransferase [Salinibacterium hongtaonis]PWB97426.1 ribosomal-protein-alanine N-acetyltransferase [Salinibacterium hongtaonis]